MTSTARNLFVLCLLALPTAALADVYQLNGPPDVSINDMTFTDSGTYATLTGGMVETLIDANGTGCTDPACPVVSNPVLPYVVMSAGQNGLVIYNHEDPSEIYLQASLVDGSYQIAGTEVGEEFIVTSYSWSDWNSWELTDAGSAHLISATDLSGAELVLDVHLGVANGDGVYNAAYADMTPAESTVTPEPATLTLLCSGLAAGLLRKRMAGKKA